MALVKSTEIKKIEVIDTWTIQVRADTIVKEDGVEISRGVHRHALQPFSSDYKVKVLEGTTLPDLDSDGKKQWTHPATDISGENSQVQAIANAAWTDDIKTSYKTWVEANHI